MKFVWILSILLPTAIWAQSSPRQTPVQIEKLGTIDPKSITEDWYFNMDKHAMPSPGGEDYRSELARRKAEVARRYPRKNYTRGGGGTWPTDSLPRIMSNFEGNLAGNGTPNDNNIAISNSGYIISVVNSNLYFYDTTGTELFNASLGAWTLPLNITSNKFDPKVIYDPRADKFILVFLNGSSSGTSKYIVCFSTSDDPMDPWNMYKLDGNPFDDNSWSDYPALAINKEDLFLTINLLTPGQSWQLGFKQSIIWQINKQSGYDGDSLLTSQIWDGITEGGINIRNLHPVRNARGQFEHQNHCYFLSNRNFAIESDTMYLVKVTGSLIAGNTSITTDRLTTDTPYFLTVDAPEPGGQELATNDSRVLGAIQESNIIQYVHNTTDTATGNTAIYHGFIDLDDLSCTGNIIKDSVFSMAYANIAGVGNIVGSQESIFTFEYTSPNDFPGFAAIFYDGANYSPIKIIKEGENKISVFNDPLERWGDYSGIQRRYNKPCTVWANGTYGYFNTDNGTWIAELGSDTLCTALPTSVVETKTEIGKLYPNPAQSLVHYELDIPTQHKVQILIYSQNGKLITQLLNDELPTGNYHYRFSTSQLSNGLYYVVAQGEDGVLSRQKLVVKK